MKKGDIVVSKDLKCLFKISITQNGFCYGCNLLDNGHFVMISEFNLIQIDQYTPLIRLLCHDEYLKIEIASLFFNTKEDIGKYIGKSDRSVFRIIEENNKKP